MIRSSREPASCSKTSRRSGVRICEEIAEEGYRGGQTILDVALRELRPRYLPPLRTHQLTIYPRSANQSELQCLGGP